MCDTLYVPKARASGARPLFAKNSDRERNEAQGLEMVPARPAAADGVRATYMRLPDDRPTLACLVSRPFWGFGAEMGVNARGVVIGNEALVSRKGLPEPQRRGGLTGMDLVRLALERASTAQEAVSTITDLIEVHGQGGDCGHLSRFHYHNGFLIADAADAFVLETVGRDWALEAVKGSRAISNAYSIFCPDRESQGLRALLDPGATHAEGGLAARLQDPARERAGRARERALRSREHLEGGLGSVGEMMAALRDHGPGDADPPKPPVKTACMHAGARGRRSQTVASMVCEIDPSGGVAWVTAASAPCLCVFRPVFFDVGLSALKPTQLGPAPCDLADPASRWWRHERAHRRALLEFGEVLAQFSPARDALEGHMIAAVESLRGAPLEKRARAQRRFWARADALEAKFLPNAPTGADGVVTGRPQGHELNAGAAAADAFQRSWRRLSRTAGLDI